jgi:hypothetical protein
MNARVLCACFVAGLVLGAAGCGSRSDAPPPAHLVTSAGSSCDRDGEVGIGGVPAQVKFHQAVTATLYVCQWDAGITTQRHWREANSAVWYLSSADSLGQYVSQGSSRYSFRLPFPGYITTGSYRLIGRSVPYTFAGGAADASTTFDASE